MPDSPPDAFVRIRQHPIADLLGLRNATTRTLRVLREPRVDRGAKLAFAHAGAALPPPDGQPVTDRFHRRQAPNW